MVVVVAVVVEALVVMVMEALLIAVVEVVKGGRGGGWE